MEKRLLISILKCTLIKHNIHVSQNPKGSARFGSTYTKIGMIQRLAWPLCKDDMQIHEVFHIFRV